MDTGGDRLATAPFEVIGRFGDASNATLLVRLLDRDRTPLSDDLALEDLDPLDLAVHKPQRGEAPLWDFPDGSLYRREVAAYVVSEVLGWDLVPRTVVRDDGPFGVGSLQRYVRHDPNRHWFALRDEGRPEIVEQLRTLVLFDLVIDNADRKAGHVLLEELSTGDRVRAIDHGVTFHLDRKLRTVAWDYALEPIPASRLADVARLGDWVAGEGQATLCELLDVSEVAALAARIREVLDLRVLPEPTGPRPYPWPLL